MAGAPAMAPPRFLRITSVVTASRVGIVCDVIFSALLLGMRATLMNELEVHRSYHVAVSVFSVSTAALGAAAIYGARRTTMLIFCLLQFFAHVLNAGALAVLIAALAGMKLRVALCDAQDCPVVVNWPLVYGIAIAAASSAGTIAGAVVLSAHVRHVRFLEARARRQRQYEAARKRGLIPGTPEAMSMQTAAGGLTPFLSADRP